MTRSYRASSSCFSLAFRFAFLPCVLANLALASDSISSSSAQAFVNVLLFLFHCSVKDITFIRHPHLHPYPQGQVWLVWSQGLGRSLLVSVCEGHRPHHLHSLSERLYLCGHKEFIQAYLDSAKRCMQSYKMT